MNDDAARRAPACSLVIFGASGDLTERKLLPAIRQLAAHHRLRPEFALIGVAAWCLASTTVARVTAADFPRFQAQEIDPHAGEIVYALTAADVDGDTDAAERCEELDEISFTDLDDDLAEDADDGDSPAPSE